MMRPISPLRGVLPFTIAVVAASCAPGVVIDAPAPPRADTVAPPPPDVLLEDAPRRVRHAVRPVPLTNAFRAAVRRGTRTLDGTPGPNYWQQSVSYRIDAELDVAQARLNGTQFVVYRNNSPDTLRNLVVHLHQNLFAQGVERVRPVPITGGMTVTRVAVDGRPVAGAARAAAAGAAGAGAFSVDGTLMNIVLARPLAPGDSLDAEFDWHFTVPPAGAPRMGHADREVFTIAQWYPQLAVYDDLAGWHARPYWGNAEFHLMYGSFDVSITLPEGWLVGATGTLENADEVLTDEARQRLRRALAQDGIVHVVTTDELAAGDATLRAPGGMLTWRFLAADVRDFAFAASNHYVWDATRVVLPADAAGDATRSVAVNALYRPEMELWTEAAAYARHALAFHAARWGPYRYPHLTTAEGPVGGMEYPMMQFVSGPRAGGQDLYRVTSHEIAHQWYPMMVGSNETDHMWQDEGLVVYMQDLSVADHFPGADPFAATQQAYLAIAGSDIERPIMREGDLYGIGPQYVVAAYHKPGTLWRALGRVIGEQTLHDALREYTRRWLFRHPAPFDLFHTIESVAGERLDWFWHPWFYETAVLDQAIRSVAIEQTAAGERVTVVVEDLGDVPMPVELELVLRDGTRERALLPVEPWLDGRRRQWRSFNVAAPVERIEIDPDGVFPDVDRANNVWIRPAG
jgi:hypothetical protein